MLPALRKFFEQRIAAQDGQTAAAAEARARLAAAALLVEVVHSDEHFTPEERAAVLASVQRKFGIEEQAAQELVDLAETESREAHDTFQFTSKINAGFSDDEKRGLIEELWRVAFSDSNLHRHEEHLIRRIADLLHVSHRDFIRSKLRVLESRD
jgi:uncharacterized tellurite resistance protein B-like protein